jgi:hypothetical protein
MIQEILNNCTVENNHIKLPPTQLDRETYLGVADKLKKIGGKWTGGKVQAFVFPHNPSELLAKIQSGEKVDLKKDFQFFETPDELAKKLVLFAEIENYQTVLEPSGGQGAIIKHIHPSCAVYTYELNPLFHERLNSFHSTTVLGTDFLQADESAKFERIVANPPFSKNQDIDHIRKMYAVLITGGVMVSVASKHWQISNNRKETEFREWLNEVDAEVYDVESGAFKESGTNAPTVIIVINK